MYTSLRGQQQQQTTPIIHLMVLTVNAIPMMNAISNNKKNMAFNGYKKSICFKIDLFF
jgi:hypothetical protein